MPVRLACQRQASRHISSTVSLGLPAEQIFRQGRIGVIAGDIARAARGDIHGDLPPRRGLKRFHQLQHGGSLAGAEIDGDGDVIGAEMFDRQRMRHGEVHDMDIVALAGAIACRVVIAEDVEMRPLAGGHLGDVGHQVVRHAARSFADKGGRVRADRVEIAQIGGGF